MINDTFIEEFNKTCLDVAGLPIENLLPENLSLLLLVHKGIVSKEELQTVTNHYNNMRKLKEQGK